MERMADGVLLFCPRADDEYLSGVSKKIPLVVVDRKVEDPNVGQVYIDNKEGARVAVEYLISQGHRRIGLMEGPSERPREQAATSWDTRKRCASTG